MRMTSLTRTGAGAAAAVAVWGLAAAGLVAPVATALRSGSGAGQRPDRPASTVVRTTDGAVRGLSRTGYDAWVGIPYAADPVGDLRWTPPAPVVAWSGVRDATHFGHRCTQGTGWDPGYEQVTVTEDCLSLNVYVPHGTARRLPVVVWIHGGGFGGGAGQDTNPRTFVQAANAVVVTVNYRLGALGYLNLPELRAEGADGPGNYGLLDQQAALRWIQANISRFGGDPRRVTIAGQSAGGTSVCALLASPTAEGLFSRAVIMSGGCSLQSAASGERQSLAFVRAVGCDTGPDVLACLRSTPAADVVAAQATAGVRPSLGGEAFPADPAVAVPAGDFNRVPVMLGQTNSERGLFTFQNYDYAGTPMTAQRYRDLVHSAFGADADAVLAEYPLSAFGSPGEAWTAVDNDFRSSGRHRLYGQLAAHVPTYAYEFAESDTPHFTSIFLIQQRSPGARDFPFGGAVHVDDLGYLWDYLGQTLPYDDDQLELSDQMIQYWGAFAATGAPDVARAPHWPAYRTSSDDIMYLSACDTSPASTDPPAACSQVSDRFAEDHNLAFWAGLG